MADPRSTPLAQRPPDRLYRLPSWLLNHLAGPANKLVLAALDPGGLQRVDYALLACLGQDGSHSQAELGRRIGIDRSDIVALVNRLEERSLVVRARDVHDRRRNTITLTAAGRRALAALERRVERAQQQFLAPLEQDERRTLVVLLQRLVDHHQGRPTVGDGQ